MIQRVGSAKAEPVDVRIVCATNDPLREWRRGVSTGSMFIHPPPLRERGDDILMLADISCAASREERRPSTARRAQRSSLILGRAMFVNSRMCCDGQRYSSDSTLEIRLRPAQCPPLPGAEPCWWRGCTRKSVSAPCRKASWQNDAGADRAVLRGTGNVTRAAKGEVNPSTIYRKMERWQPVNAHRSPTFKIVRA